MLKLGSSGKDVVAWQEFLISQGYDLGPKGADGNFGIFTAGATHNLQEKHGIEHDGIVGKETLALMNKVNIVLQQPIISNQESVSYPETLLSTEGIQLILNFEVGGKEDYDKKFSRPTFPGEASGITIGIGWDLRFNTTDKFDKVWGFLNTDRIITSTQYVHLKSYCGVQGTKYDEKQLRDIIIPWYSALKIFHSDTIPRFWALTVQTFPGVENLDSNARSALLSLVFNRGGGLSGSRRLQMREIRDAVAKKDYTLIAMCIRAMIPLWQKTTIYLGMKNRRNAEADLVLKV